MKKFYYYDSESEYNKRTWTIAKETKIFELKKNQMNFVWYVERSTGSTRWADSEVMERLADNWYLPKKVLQENNKYYYTNDRFSINSL